MELFLDYLLQEFLEATDLLKRRATADYAPDQHVETLPEYLKTTPPVLPRSGRTPMQLFEERPSALEAVGAMSSPRRGGMGIGSPLSLRQAPAGAFALRQSPPSSIEDMVIAPRPGPRPVPASSIPSMRWSSLRIYLIPARSPMVKTPILARIPSFPHGVMFSNRPTFMSPP